MNERTRKLTILAMLCAISYLVMAVGRVPVVMFLKYDPKDVVITIGGFLFGPMSAFAISMLVSLVEFLTVSDTGIIGLFMNVLSSCAFACVAAYIYKKKHTIAGAVTGLLTGLVVMTAVMMLWNYFITPFYMGAPREEVAKLLVPAILPFNLLKGGLNAAITMLLYKPVVTALRKARLVPESLNTAPQNKKISLGAMLSSAVVLISCILLVLVMRGII